MHIICRIKISVCLYFSSFFAASSFLSILVLFSLSPVFLPQPTSSTSPSWWNSALTILDVLNWASNGLDEEVRSLPVKQKGILVGKLIRPRKATYDLRVHSQKHSPWQYLPVLLCLERRVPGQWPGISFSCLSTPYNIYLKLSTFNRIIYLHVFIWVDVF